MAIDERLVRGVAGIDCQRDRLDPKIAAAERRPVVRHLHPAAVPPGAGRPLGLGIPRHGDLLPILRPSAWPSGEKTQQPC